MAAESGVRPGQRLDWLLRLEWGVVFIAAVAGYALLGGSWTLFLLLILAPDLSMLGYLAGARVGAIAYNSFHVLIWPACLIATGLWAGSATATEIGLIWLAHVAMDRALGYGLKLPTGFKDTHLGRIGR